MANEKKKSGSAVPFVVGAAIAGAAVGVAAGVLLAPQSGEETRKEIVNKGKEILEKGETKGKEILKNGQELAQKGEEMAKGKIKEVAKTVSDKMSEK